MPTIAKRLPLRAVAGESSRCRPTTKAMIATRSTSSIQSLRSFLVLAAEHLQHAFGDHKAADDVDRSRSVTAISGERPCAMPLTADARRRAIAPTSTMPWIALVPDISGVCSIVGTFEITSKPTKTARTNTVSSGSDWRVPHEALRHEWTTAPSRHDEAPASRRRLGSRSRRRPVNATASSARKRCASRAGSRRRHRCGRVRCRRSSRRRGRPSRPAR